MTPPTLSVCIITQARAAWLRRAMASVAPVADEIVCVDGGSTDDTESVIRSFPNARYLRRDWPGDFADQKNFAIDQAKGDWVFILDHDEMVGERFRRGVRKWIASPRRSHYKLARYWLCATDPLRYVRSEKLHPDYQTRLFRNLPVFRYRPKPSAGGAEWGSVHHAFPRADRGPGKKLRFVHLFHFDFLYNDRAAREAKVRFYTEREPATAELTRRYYLYEDYPHAVRRCWEKLGVPL